MFKHFFTLLVLQTLLTSCGSLVEKRQIKAYVLAIASGNETYKPMIQRLVEDYNSQLGITVLEFSDSYSDANSPVIITKGLEKRDGKVGWGQWSAATERKGLVFPIKSSPISETTRYSLRIELDEDFLTSNSDNDSDGRPNEQVRKLFAHEIGHGFQLTHVEDSADIMYFDISGAKDFSTYWPKVKKFFDSDKN